MSVAGSDGRVQPARPGDPSRVGPYRIIGRLGTGGMGIVHAGLTTDGLRVAVKVIHSAQAEDPEFRARFRREVQLSARVQGPCLVPLLAADAEAAEPWLATAYAPGPTLNQHVTNHGPLDGGTLYAFATGTAQALAAIHQAGVVHRDMKPQNVILTPAGPRVLDFGIARASDGTSVTRTGIMTGIPGWISPEYYRSSTAGPEGDMFAWGALVAYAATGRHPFGTGVPEAVAFRVMSGDPDLIGVPEQLREILERVLAKDPSERMAAVDAAQECSTLLASQVTQVLGADGGLEPTQVGDMVAAEWNVPTLDDPTWHVSSPSSRKRILAAVLVAVAVVGGIAGAALAFPTNGDSEAGSTRAAAESPTVGPTKTTTTRANAVISPTQASGSGEASEPPNDPRSAVVPSDPLAGVVNPAFTRAGDATEPTSDEWRVSAPASTSEQKNVAKAIRDRMTAMLATKDMEQFST